MKVTGAPWKPYLFSDKDDLPTRPPPPAIDKLESDRQTIRETDAAQIPRSFAITRRDLVNDGYTPACPECYAAAKDRKHKPHTSICRESIGKALIEDETQPHRVVDAKDREDVSLENAIKEAEAERIIKMNAPQPEANSGPTPPTPVGPVPADNSHSEERSNDREDDMVEDTTNFHEFVDANVKEQEMYDDTRSIPSDNEDMISFIIAVVHKHVTEVWSQPRDTAMSQKYNLVPGAAYDIETNDKDGSPWDFDIPEHATSVRAKYWSRDHCT